MRRRWRRRVQVGRKEGASHAREERRGLWQAASVQYHRDLGSRCADQMSREYRYECSRQLLHWYYALVLGALSSWLMMSGEALLPCFGRHFLRPENGAELPRQVQSRHDLVCDRRLSTARPESQGPVFDEIGRTHQSGLGTGAVRLLRSPHHHCCHQEEVREYQAS